MKYYLNVSYAGERYDTDQDPQEQLREYLADNYSYEEVGSGYCFMNSRRDLDFEGTSALPDNIEDLLIEAFGTDIQVYSISEEDYASHQVEGA